MHVKAFALTGFLSIAPLAAGAATAPAHGNPAFAHAPAALPYAMHTATNGAFARYPLAMDSLVWNEQKVEPPDTGYDQLFGFAVAIDGNTALVGAFQADGTTDHDEGRTYVITKDGDTWTQAQVLTASDGAPVDGFGIAVAIDGNTAVVGAFAADVGGNSNQGAAYVFTRSGGTWSETQKLTADDGAAEDEFGLAVAVSGTTVFVGAPYAGIDGNAEQGAVYVFDGSGGSWNQVQKLTANDGAGGDQFGLSASLDGDTALLGAPFASIGVNDGQGAAYLFTRSGGTWTQAQKLSSNDGGPGDAFARSVTLDGGTALVGAPFHFVDGAASQGAAYVFTGADGSWQERKELLASDGAALDEFGWSVALEGTTALAGAPVANVGGNLGQGAAYLFTGAGANWIQAVKLTASDGAAFDVFGDAVAVSGTTALAGAPFVQLDNGVLLGAAYFYDASCPEGYGEHDGALNAGGLYATAPYQAPAGLENAILGAPGGFALYVQYSNGGAPHVLRIPGNQIHRPGPAGTYRWGVKAGDKSGNYTLCILHP